MRIVFAYLIGICPYAYLLFQHVVHMHHCYSNISKKIVIGAELIFGCEFVEIVISSLVTEIWMWSPHFENNFFSDDSPPRLKLPGVLDLELYQTPKN